MYPFSFLRGPTIWLLREVWVIWFGWDFFPKPLEIEYSSPTYNNVKFFQCRIFFSVGYFCPGISLQDLFPSKSVKSLAPNTMTSNIIFSVILSLCRFGDNFLLFPHSTSMMLGFRVSYSQTSCDLFRSFYPNLQIIRKVNSIIVLLFFLNNLHFKN